MGQGGGQARLPGFLMPHELLTPSAMAGFVLETLLPVGQL